jgi:FdhD protein
MRRRRLRLYPTKHKTVPLLCPINPRKNVVRVELAPDVKVSLANLERNFYTTSSCGICGKASLLALQTVCPARIKNTFSIDAQLLYTLPSRFTGGAERLRSHWGPSLFDATGQLLGLREDVGRHNTRQVCANSVGVR